MATFRSRVWSKAELVNKQIEVVRWRVRGSDVSGESQQMDESSVTDVFNLNG